MRVFLLRLVVISMAASAAAIPACGSNTSSAPPEEQEAGTGGHKGTGGKSASSGGASGASGSTSSTGGSAMTGCDTSSCDMLVSGFAALGIKSCCVSATKCGIDTSGIGALLGGAAGGVMLPACIDPGSFTPPTTTPPSITVLDGGIIPVNNDLPIQLDSSCPGIETQGVDQQMNPVTIDMPGCCRPETNTCGASTHKLAGAGSGVPLRCAGYDEVATSAATNLGPGVVIPDDPNIRCKYTAAPVGVPDSGAPDSGAGDSGSGGAAGAGGTSSTGGASGSGGTATGGAGGTSAAGAGGT